MTRLLIAVLLFGCAMEEESSDVASTLDAAKRAEEAPVSIARADVNEDGIVDILDLTAASYWMGEKVADWLGAERVRLVERQVSSKLLENPNIEVGKFFSVSIWAALDSGTRMSADFYTAGEVDGTCRLTTELVAVDADGEVVSDALLSFSAYGNSSDPFIRSAGLGAPVVRVSGSMNGQGYGAYRTTTFTNSALEKNVVKLIVKSGSVCGAHRSGDELPGREKVVTPLVEVKQIPVTLLPRSDDLRVEADLYSAEGHLYLKFSRLPFPDMKEGLRPRDDDSERTHLVIMLVDDEDIQRGYYSSETGVLSRSSREAPSRWQRPDLGQHWRGDQGQFDYIIFKWRQLTELNPLVRVHNNIRIFSCKGEGARVFVALQRLHRRTKRGGFSPVKGSTQVYEGPCHRL